jgi:hypothetical protein
VPKRYQLSLGSTSTEGKRMSISGALKVRHETQSLVPCA